jgi:predicted SprT family Zn-dependent metalloprotease
MPRGPKPLKSRLKKNEFYCLSCRKKVTGDDIKERKVKNSKRGSVPMLKAYCHKCDGKLSKIVG